MYKLIYYSQLLHLSPKKCPHPRSGSWTPDAKKVGQSMHSAQQKLFVLEIAMRIVLASLSMVGMFQSFQVDFSFTGAAVLEFVLLFLYFNQTSRP